VAAEATTQAAAWQWINMQQRLAASLVDWTDLSGGTPRDALPAEAATALRDVLRIVRCNDRATDCRDTLRFLASATSSRNLI
jgi:hypothetical protein